MAKASDSFPPDTTGGDRNGDGRAVEATATTGVNGGGMTWYIGLCAKVW